MTTTMSTVEQDALARLTADHLSEPSLRFLRAIRDGEIDPQSGVVRDAEGSFMRWFTAADWSDFEDLTADELLDEFGVPTAMGDRVLAHFYDQEHEVADCGV